MNESRRLEIAIVGGGITGLAAAYRLVEHARDTDRDLAITLYEASPRIGGVLQTERRDGFLIERAGDMFTTREPDALRLCQRLGMESELTGTNQQHRRAFIWSRNTLHPVPEGFALMRPSKASRVLASPLLSWRGKLRLLAEPLVRSAGEAAEDESLQSFATRRLGVEAYERLVQPLIGGIYTADPTRLSMAATMNEFLEMERKYGSLFRGGRKKTGKNSVAESEERKAARQAGGARYNQFLAPRNGLQQLVETLEASLSTVTIRRSHPVVEIQPTRGAAFESSLFPPAAAKAASEARAWSVRSESPEQSEREQQFDGVILATPAPIASRQLSGAMPDLGELLGRIPYAGVNVAILAYHRRDIAHPLNGFGLVVPLIEKRNVLAVSFASVKFPGRAPDDQVLLRVFAGGACQPELNDLESDEVLRMVRGELAELLGVSGEPRFEFVVNWQGTMPQYHVGHLGLVDRIEQHIATQHGLELAGNAYRGVGIPYCIRSGESAADRLLKQLRPSG